MGYIHFIHDQVKGGYESSFSRAIGETNCAHDELLNRTKLAAAAEERLGSKCKARCLPNALNFPLLEDYDFHNDTINPDLDNNNDTQSRKSRYVGSAWDEFKHVRQAFGFLVIYKKYSISYDELTNDLCPVLSVQQLYRICTYYWDDNYNSKSVSEEVISSLMAKDSNTADSSSILLDNNSSVPFSAYDLFDSLQVKDFADVKPAVELAENPAFLFLL